LEETNKPYDRNNRSDRGERGERNESFEVTLRRFFRDVQQSGILTEIKKRRFRDKEISRSKRRVAARRKTEIRRIKRGY
jgi:ribosomal protein S21